MRIDANSFFLRSYAFSWEYIIMTTIDIERLPKVRRFRNGKREKSPAIFHLSFEINPNRSDIHRFDSIIDSKWTRFLRRFFFFSFSNRRANAIKKIIHADNAITFYANFISIERHSLAAFLLLCGAVLSLPMWVYPPMRIQAVQLQIIICDFFLRRLTLPSSPIYATIECVRLSIIRFVFCQFFLLCCCEIILFHSIWSKILERILCKIAFFAQFFVMYINGEQSECTTQ